MELLENIHIEKTGLNHATQERDRDRDARAARLRRRSCVEREKCNWHYSILNRRGHGGGEGVLGCRDETTKLPSVAK